MTALNRLVFWGDSHIHAVKDAIQKGISPSFSKSIEVHRLTKIKNGKLIGDINLEDLKQVCKTLTADDMLVSLVGGNQHSSLSLIQHQIPFYVLNQGDETIPPDLAQTHQIIPRETIKYHFSRGLQHNDVRRIFEVASAGSQQMVHLSAPPPKEDTAHILKRVETDFIARGIMEIGVTPAPLRLRIWEVQNEALRDLLAEKNIPLLPPPPNSQTPEGYLHPDFYAQDATHANWRYGQKILESLESALNLGKKRV